MLKDDRMGKGPGGGRRTGGEEMRLDAQLEYCFALTAEQENDAGATGKGVNGGDIRTTLQWVAIPGQEGRWRKQTAGGWRTGVNTGGPRSGVLFHMSVPIMTGEIWWRKKEQGKKGAGTRCKGSNWSGGGGLFRLRGHGEGRTLRIITGETLLLQGDFSLFAGTLSQTQAERKNTKTRGKRGVGRGKEEAIEEKNLRDPPPPEKTSSNGVVNARTQNTGTQKFLAPKRTEIRAAKRGDLKVKEPACRYLQRKVTERMRGCKGEQHKADFKLC